MQGIANFFEVKQEEITPEVVIQKIGNSLQNNSVLFIEIYLWGKLVYENIRCIFFTS